MVDCIFFGGNEDREGGVNDPSLLRIIIDEWDLLLGNKCFNNGSEDALIGKKKKTKPNQKIWKIKKLGLILFLDHVGQVDIPHYKN